MRLCVDDFGVFIRRIYQMRKSVYSNFADIVFEWEDDL